MNLFKIIFGVYFLTYSSVSFSQNLKEKEIEKEFWSHTINEEYALAYEKINQLLTIDSKNPIYHYEKGLLELEYFENYVKSIECINNAIDLDKKRSNYKRQQLISYESNYYLGVANHSIGQYSIAKEAFEKFISIANKDNGLIPQAELRIKQCEVAESLKLDSKSIEIINMGSGINTSFSEYCSVFNLSGNSFYFCSKRPWDNKLDTFSFDSKSGEYHEDIYYSRLNESGTASISKLIYSNQKTNEAPVSLNSYNSSLILYTDSFGNGDLYESKMGMGLDLDFNKLIGINEINSGYWDPHCVISYDGQRMIFSSDRPGGYGGRDLYIIYRNTDQLWGDPINLGDKINSKYDEDSPFLSTSGDILYFSSNGENSCGGFDIFYSKRLSNNQWSKAENAGMPINTSLDDLYYVESLDGQKRMLTSNRMNGLGKKDLYWVNSTIVEHSMKFTATVNTEEIKNHTITDENTYAIELKCLNCIEKESADVVGQTNIEELTTTENEKIRVLYLNNNDNAYHSEITREKLYLVKIINSSNKESLYEETFSSVDPISRNSNIINKSYKLVYENGVIVCKRENTSIEDSIPLKEIDTVTVKAFKGLEFLQYFSYNKNTISLKKFALKHFLSEVEDQLNKGKGVITLKIYSSASKVPTKRFESNQQLSELRAENLKYDLITYFSKNEKYNGRVNIVIVSTIVDGPEYNRDADKKDKYRSYQFVGIKTE